MMVPADLVGETMSDVESLIDALVESLRRHTGVLRLKAYPDPDDDQLAYVGERSWSTSKPHSHLRVAPPGIWYLPAALRRPVADRVVERYAEKLQPLSQLSIVGSG